jgi:hypothetical protein
MATPKNTAKKKLDPPPVNAPMYSDGMLNGDWHRWFQDVGVKVKALDQAGATVANASGSLFDGGNAATVSTGIFDLGSAA